MKRLLLVLLVFCVGLAAGCKEEAGPAKAVEGVKETAAEVTEAAKEAAGSVKEKTVEAAGAVKEKTVEVAGAVKEKAAEAAGSVKEAIPVEIDTGQGEKIFKARCVACHGAGGAGTGMAPAFVGNDWIKGATKAEIADVVKNGRTGAAKRHKDFAMGMPPQAGMPDEDVDAVVDYLKSLD